MFIDLQQIKTSLESTYRTRTQSAELYNKNQHFAFNIVYNRPSRRRPTLKTLHVTQYSNLKERRSIS